jgi:hypothetical protein
MTVNKRLRMKVISISYEFEYILKKQKDYFIIKLMKDIRLYIKETKQSLYNRLISKAESKMFVDRWIIHHHVKLLTDHSILKG